MGCRERQEYAGSTPAVSSMRIYYKKVRNTCGTLKCLSKLGADMKPVKDFYYFKTWREAFGWLRSRHKCPVQEDKWFFMCEVPDV